ncbi:unnamed protein product, partial [Soboliphyme baturini]|uniref:Alkaline phosphatase n=1 Tax=Soboliphyme baturini TaxID=241478 RepID=A0A183JAK8_9BILA
TATAAEDRQYNEALAVAVGCVNTTKRSRLVLNGGNRQCDAVTTGRMKFHGNDTKNAS